MKHFMLPRNPMARENPNSFETPTSPNPNFPKPSSSSPYSSRKHKSSKENTPPSSDPNHDPSMPPKSTAKSSRAHHLPPRPPSSAHNPLKRKLNMDANNSALAENHSLAGCSDTGVKVIVRMRPPNKNEEEGDMIVQKVSRDSLAIHGQTFTFDAVADTNSTQEEIFQLVGAPLVENCLAGFNSSIFAYGQTGSGKTYTMWGPANAFLERNGANSQQGLTPRVFERLFARIEEEQVNKQLTYQCRCSFLEIYNEQITDLLDPVQRNLQIREDVKSGVYVENLTEELVCTMDDVTQILIKGFSNRKIGATSLNAESSRSHSVFTCVVESRSKCASDGLSSIRLSRINLVDLAGSERQKLTGTAGERLKEAGNINRSLSQLGNLINILAEVSQSGKQRHIPYRDSRLTFLLQESLGGNAKLAMICAVSPAQSCKSETFSTLRFAQRAKTIKNAAVVNEVTQDDVNVLRDVIRQLKDELLRMKENGNNSNGGCATGWNARRSLNLLKRSLNCPMTLSNIEEDSDEEMEIDEEAVERLSVQVSCSSESSEQDITNDVKSARTQQPNVLSQIPSGNIIVSEETDVNMEDCQLGVTSEGGEKHCIVSGTTKVVEIGDKHGEESIKKNPGISDCRILARNPEEQSIVDNFSESVDGIGSEIIPVTSLPRISPTHSPNSVIPSELSVTSADVSPVLKSPPLSISPRLNSSRRSLKTSSMVSASQKDLTQEECLETEAPCLSFGHMKSGPVKAPSTRTSKNYHASTEHLEESLHRGFQIIDNHRQSTSLRRSSFRFSYKPTELKSILLVEKVDVGVQTLPEDCGKSEDPAGYLCGECMRRVEHNVSKELNENSEMQLVPVDESLAADKSKIQVPKAVEKVLAGAIRREMALDEFCTKQTAEISQLNRLIQQYKHERECNAIIGQTREDKIVRLENLMDGILPTEEFMQEELLSLANEHKLLKAKYDNHPEVLRTRIELKRVQDDLDAYRNFFDMGERDVLIEEIHHLRSQLKYYVDSSPIPSNNRSSLLQLTHPESSSGPLSTISESTEESVEDKFEQERRRWTEIESDWISLAEELKVELEASRSLVKKQHQELESEKKCSEELKEAMQMAMQGHARMLEQYADLQESHFELLARHRKMQEGIEDVKRAAARAGVKGAESRFINSLAAEISALRAEKEKERQYLMDENKGLQAQLRDTAEAVQAAGELLVRLKEAEEIAIDAQKRAGVAEQEAEKANRQVEGLKKQHKMEMDSLNQMFAESRLPKEALRPVCNDSPNSVKYDTTDCLSAGDEKWKEEFQQLYDRVDKTEVSKLEDPASWYAGYDRCNI